jgi:hypothetical protein
VLERLVDVAARDLGIDRVEIRRRNAERRDIARAVALRHTHLDMPATPHAPGPDAQGNQSMAPFSHRVGLGAQHQGGFAFGPDQPTRALHYGGASEACTPQASSPSGGAPSTEPGAVGHEAEHSAEGRQSTVMFCDLVGSIVNAVRSRRRLSIPLLRAITQVE